MKIRVPDTDTTNSLQKDTVILHVLRNMHVNKVWEEPHHMKHTWQCIWNE